MSEGSVQLDIKAGVGTITFEHPKSNSLPKSLLAKLAETVTACGKNKEVNVVLLQSAGTGAFCAGASFDELKSISNAEQGKEFFMGFARLILALTRCPKITVARVQGKVVGGGVGMVAACDYSFAAPTAASRLSEFAIGIGPFVVGPCVERRIGPSRFASMTVGADWYSAEWSADAGLYSELASSIEDLDERVNRFVAKMAVSSVEAAAEIKKILWEDTSSWEKLLPERAEISGRLVLSDFVRKALAAAAAK